MKATRRHFQHTGEFSWGIFNDSYKAMKTMLKLTNMKKPRWFSNLAERNQSRLVFFNNNKGFNPSCVCSPFYRSRRFTQVVNTCKYQKVTQQWLILIKIQRRNSNLTCLTAYRISPTAWMRCQGVRSSVQRLSRSRNHTSKSIHHWWRFTLSSTLIMKTRLCHGLMRISLLRYGRRRTLKVDAVIIATSSNFQSAQASSQASKRSSTHKRFTTLTPSS